MQMRRCSSGITGVADMTDHGAADDDLSGSNGSERLEVRVIVPLSAWSEDPDDVAAAPTEPKTAQQK